MYSYSHAASDVDPDTFGIVDPAPGPEVYNAGQFSTDTAEKAI